MKLEKGMLMPEFSYTTADGSEHKLDDLLRQGKKTAILYRMLDIFAAVSKDTMRSAHVDDKRAAGSMGHRQDRYA